MTLTTWSGNLPNLFSKDNTSMTYHTVNVQDNTKKLLTKLAKRDGRTIGTITQEATILYAKTFPAKREPIKHKAGRPTKKPNKTPKTKQLIL